MTTETKSEMQATIAGQRSNIEMFRIRIEQLERETAEQRKHHIAYVEGAFEAFEMVMTKLLDR